MIVSGMINNLKNNEFIDKDEVLKIDTRTGEYVSRA